MATESTGSVLFLPLFKGTFIEMLPIAQAIRDAGKWKPVFALDAKMASLLPSLKNIEAIRTDGAPLAAKPEGAQSTSTSSPKKRIFSLLPAFFQALALFRTEKRRAKQLFNRHPDIRLLMVASDRNVGIETACVMEARKRGISVLIVPFAMSFPHASAEPRLRSGARGGKYGVHTLLRRLLKLLFPSWVWVYKNTPLFFQPPYHMLAAWVLGIMPKKPWVIGGGEATLMAVESESEREQLQKQGMRPEKMVVTGKPSLDDIARQLATVKTDDVRRRLGIDPQEKLLVCSVPQHAEHDLLTWERHKEEMTYLFQTLAKTGAHVLLSLHPRCDRSWYQPIADAAGVRIVDERIYQLLPACDVFTACYSSIVAQAIALHKPTVVFDFYDMLYPPFDTAPGVTVVREREKFLPELMSLLTDRDRHALFAKAQRDKDTAWAILDGKSTERVLKVAENIMVSS